MVRWQLALAVIAVSVVSSAEVEVGTDGSLQAASSKPKLDAGVDVLYRPADDDDRCQLQAKEGDAMELAFNITLPGKPEVIIDNDKNSGLLRATVGQRISGIVPVALGRMGSVGSMCVGEVRRATLKADIGMKSDGSGPIILKSTVQPDITVQPTEDIVVTFKNVKTNHWDGSRHEPPPRIDVEGIKVMALPNLDICGWAPDKEAFVKNRSTGFHVDCRLANFGKPSGQLPHLTITIPTHLKDGATEHGCEKGSFSCGESGCSGKLLMVRRGMCPFYEKYKVASKLGVAGLVVVDSEPLGPKGLITLTGAPESDKSEDALVVAISKEHGDVLWAMVEKQTAAKVPQAKRAVWSFSVPLTHKDNVMAHDSRKQIAMMSEAGVACGPLPRALLNFAIALARAKLYDFSTQAFEFAMRKADECSADEAKAKEVPEGHEEGAELTQKERLAGLNMMSAMYAEWGHLDAAVDCARRIRELGGPTARVEHETRVRCETTQGDFELSTWRTLAMLGHDNFMMLIDGDFYRDSGIYRVTDKLAQWGFASNPRTQAKHVRKFNKIDDDYSLETNVDRGTISYFGHGSKSRHTSVFIAKKFMPPEMTPSMLDAGKDTWLRPFGKVTKGMDVIDRLYGGYGEVEQEGQKDGEAGPNMLQIQLSGNAYLKKNFPKLDYIKTCYLVHPNGETTKDSKKTDLYAVPQGNPAMESSGGNS